MLLETKRRSVPDGSGIWSWNAHAGYTTDECACWWRKSRTQGNLHMGEDLDHSRIHEMRLPARMQHSTNNDQSLQKLDHNWLPPAAVSSAGETWGKVNHSTCAVADTWDAMSWRGKLITERRRSKGQHVDAIGTQRRLAKSGRHVMREVHQTDPVTVARGKGERDKHRRGQRKAQAGKVCSVMGRQPSGAFMLECNDTIPAP